jgi:YesN/AraC family two-component response regulator
MTDHIESAHPAPMVPGAIADLLEDLLSEIQSARAVPLSNNVMINQEEILDRLHQAIEDLPEELRAARWMVREREAYISRTNEKARDLLVKAREESERLVSDNYVVQEAVEEANALVRNAESEGRRIRLEAEDFAERHLSEAESVLGELYRYITEARAELHKALPPAEPPPVSE